MPDRRRRVPQVLRARQTGEIIAQELGLSLLRDADPLLAEGAPCPTPGWEPYPSTMFEDGARIEARPSTQRRARSCLEVARGHA